MSAPTTLSLRQKLQKGQNVYNSCINPTAPMWPKVIQQTGVDFVFLDTERIPVDRADLARLRQQFRAYGITPIVRIPSTDPFRACQAIDGGAIGIVASYLESAAQIQALVGATKFRPLKGEQLTAYLTGREEMSDEMQAYIADYNADTICIANIESVPALNRLNELLSVPGLDAVFIGPHDLSASLGLPEQYDHPDFEAAVRSIIHQTRAKGLSIGIHFSLEPERQIQWMKEGVNIVVHGFDVALFSQRLRHDLRISKEAVGDDLSADTNAGLVI